MYSDFKNNNDNGLWVDNIKMPNSSVSVSNDSINGSIDLVNAATIKLPKTGTSTSMIIFMAGILIMCLSPLLKFKKTKK